jgi:hypothetical protein
MNIKKQKEIFYNLAELQFKKPETDMEYSQQCCKDIAKKYNIDLGEVYKIIARGVKEKFKTPEYPAYDFGIKENVFIKK